VKWIFYSLVLLSSASACATPTCNIDHTDDIAIITYHYDGDTVKLKDSRKVRLVGINTPEVEHKRKKSQLYASKARDFLKTLLPEGSPVRLRYAKQKKDHYGRTLAHLFDMQGKNIQAELITHGFATTLIVPPNTWQAECYHQLEKVAISRNTGIWSLQPYKPVTVSELNHKKKGFQIIKGQITRIGESRNNLWLNMGRDFSIRIQKDDLQYFKRYEPASLKGRFVTVQGWLQKRKGQYRMQLRHPLALTLDK
jgi:endonuclease YncB( thermonuclease family)